MNDFVKHHTLSSKSRPAFDAQVLTDRLEQLGPMLKAAARQVETDGRVPDSHIEAIRATGFFEVVKPAAYGGDAQSLETLIAANMVIAKYCASTAWVSGLLAAHQWLLAGFPEKAQQDVWNSDANALICGSYAPAAKVAVAAGGFVLTGNWSFTSGCANATWAFCAAIVPSMSNPDAWEPAFLLVPASDYTISNTWDVVGLAGTGSNTLVLNKAFVPAHRVLRFAEAVSGNTPGAQLAGPTGGLRVPMLCAIPPCLSSVAIGSAQGALESYLEATGGRTTRGAVAGGHQKMAEFPTIQLRVADAAANIDAAREILLRDLRRVTDKALSGEAITEEDRILCRRGQAFTVSLALRAVEALNASTGGLGLSMSNPVQRAWRDVNAVGRHISLNWDAVGTMYGQMALGLPPKGQY